MPIRTLVFSASKQLYAGCDDGSVLCFDCRTESFALVDSLQGHTEFVTAVDESAKPLPSFVFSAGRIGVQIETSPAELVKALPYTFADLTKDE